MRAPRWRRCCRLSAAGIGRPAPAMAGRKSPEPVQRRCARRNCRGSADARGHRHAYQNRAAEPAGNPVSRRLPMVAPPTAPRPSPAARRLDAGRTRDPVEAGKGPARQSATSRRRGCCSNARRMRRRPSAALHAGADLRSRGARHAGHPQHHARSGHGAAWYQKAAQLGSADAQQRLAQLAELTHFNWLQQGTTCDVYLALALVAIMLAFGFGGARRGNRIRSGQGQ